MIIGLVAHDNRKEDLLEWVEFNKDSLSEHDLICTGTTGKLISKIIPDVKSGPLGGDQELGADIANGKVDLLIFFWDPMAAQPHDPDVKALLRMTVIYNIPTACNRSTADFLISSPLFIFRDKGYSRILKDYSKYINRKV
jgi:methylglyoxal synthase